MPQKLIFQRKKIALVRFELVTFGLLSQSANHYATKNFTDFFKRKVGSVYLIRNIHRQESTKIQIDLACHNSNLNNHEMRSM